LFTAAFQYQSTYGVFPADITMLGGTAGECGTPTRAHACLIDEVLANSSPSHPKSGYVFGVKLGPKPQTFLIWAVPVDRRNRAFCGIEDGVVRIDPMGSNLNAVNYATCRAMPPVVD
jgi:hypothetical protein